MLPMPGCCLSPEHVPPDLRRLTNAYSKLTVVGGIKLALAAGEFVSLLSPSGYGKAISAPGLVLPPERRRMFMIFQSNAIWLNMTVAENVAFSPKCASYPLRRCGGASPRSWRWCIWAI